MHQRKLFGTALAILAIFSICGALPGITANTAPLPLGVAKLGTT